MPIMDTLTSLVITFLEMLKSGLGIRIARNNQKIEENSTKTQRLIGFTIPDEEEVKDNDL
jgi:hypothetical protein